MPTDTLTKEQWKPVIDFPAYEISNAWRFRKASNGKILLTKGHGGAAMVELIDRKGRRHSKSVRRTGQTHWGHQHDIVLDNTTKPREHAPVRELANPISHQPGMTFTEATPEQVDDLLEKSRQFSEAVDTLWATDDTKEYVTDVDTDQGLRVRYRDVEWPGVREDYYQVSDLGEVITCAGGVLSPLKRGSNVRMSLRRSDRQGSAQVRLDLLVCTAFHGPRPGEDYLPRHINDDPRDCRADNLRWEKVYIKESRGIDLDLIRAEQHATALTGVNFTETEAPGLPVPEGKLDANTLKESPVPLLPIEDITWNAEALTPDIPAEVQVTTTTVYRHGLVTASVDGDVVTIDIEDCACFDIHPEDVDSLIRVLSAIS